MKLSTLAAFAVAGSMIVTVPAFAQDKKMDHSGHGVAQSETAAPAADEVVAKAKINSVDADKGMVNVDHGPIPEIGWPAMTMDIAVTNRVDLSTVEPGSDVKITLRKGRDNQFRIVEIAPAQ